MLHFVGQGLEEGALPCPRGSQKKGHATRLDGTADIVQDDKSGLAGPNANEANECLQSEVFPLKTGNVSTKDSFSYLAVHIADDHDPSMAGETKTSMLSGLDR